MQLLNKKYNKLSGTVHNISSLLELFQLKFSFRGKMVAENKTKLPTCRNDSFLLLRDAGREGVLFLHQSDSTDAVMTVDIYFCSFLWKIIYLKTTIFTTFQKKTGFIQVTS